ncbi:hypothetical protein G9A89_020055 [Geosiphon pyriformis]|nr:hypothetical protein G9A89_020055 [Geosiphon pyriformis]
MDSCSAGKECKRGEKDSLFQIIKYVIHHMAHYGRTVWLTPFEFMLWYHIMIFIAYFSRSGRTEIGNAKGLETFESSMKSGSRKKLFHSLYSLSPITSFVRAKGAID